MAPDSLPFLPRPWQSLDTRIRFAIEQLRLVRLTYDDRARMAEPHDYGLISGEARLLVFQLRDETRPARPPGWRLLDLDQIGTLEVLEASFPGSRNEGQPHRFQWDPLFARAR